MKALPVWALLLCLGCTAVPSGRLRPDYRADLKRAAFGGAADEGSRLKAIIQPLFPIGLEKSEVAERLRTNFQLADKDLNFTSSEKEPIKMVRDGKELRIASWISAELLSFRSLRSLGTKNYISAQYNFDEQGRLAYFSVSVSYGPEL